MRKRSGKHRYSGFSLVELLVVIAIIGTLSTIAVVAMVQARKAGKEAKAKGDLSTIRTAIAVMLEDTGKWPNGCPPDGTSNPEVNINDAAAGITTQPVEGDQGDGCEWTASEVAAWDGPYIVNPLTDPWGNDFWFDPDYEAFSNCGSKATKPDLPSIVSFGENGTGLNVYDCDDIWLSL